MSRLLLLPTLAVACVTSLAACNPALNWREVRVQGLVALLPCKPDRAQRTVPLGTQEVVLDMVGCETAGALYAVSHVHLDNAERADAARAEWRQQTLATMRAASVQELPFKKPHPAMTAYLLTAQGLRPDGSVVVARLLWLVSGADLYHVAVYGDRLDDEATEMLFSGLHPQ